MYSIYPYYSALWSLVYLLCMCSQTILTILWQASILLDTCHWRKGGISFCRARMNGYLVWFTKMPKNWAQWCLFQTSQRMFSIQVVKLYLFCPVQETDIHGRMFAHPTQFWWPFLTNTAAFTQCYSCSSINVVGTAYELMYRGDCYVQINEQRH